MLWHLGKGANSIANIAMVRADKMQYITAKKLNKSDDKIIANYYKCSPELIDGESGIYGFKKLIVTNLTFLIHVCHSETFQSISLQS